MKFLSILFLCLLTFVSCSESEEFFFQEIGMNNQSSAKSSNSSKPSLDLQVSFDEYEDVTETSFSNERKIWTIKTNPKDKNGSLIDIDNSPNSFIKIWVYEGDETFYNFPYNKLPPTNLTFYGKFGLNDVIFTESDNPSPPILLGIFKNKSIQTYFWQHSFFLNLRHKKNGDIDDAVIGEEFRFAIRSKASLQICPNCAEGTSKVYYVVFQLKHNGETSKKRKVWFSDQ